MCLIHFYKWNHNRVLKSKVAAQNEDYKRLLNQKKSSEIRLGRIGENMAPFFTEWPYDQRAFRFLGHPIDGIQFSEDEIIFIEIKTGMARLTTNQKRIRNLVSEGKVRFATFRVDENGCHLKVAR